MPYGGRIPQGPLPAEPVDPRPFPPRGPMPPLPIDPRPRFGAQGLPSGVGSRLGYPSGLGRPRTLADLMALVGRRSF